MVLPKAGGTNRIRDLYQVQYSLFNLILVRKSRFWQYLFVKGKQLGCTLRRDK
jgi:hypothetical protein